MKTKKVYRVLLFVRLFHLCYIYVIRFHFLNFSNKYVGPFLFNGYLSFLTSFTHVTNVRWHRFLLDKIKLFKTGDFMLFYLLLTFCVYIY